MAEPQWPERLQEELRKRGLPPGYAARLAEELTDHFTDIQKESRSMDARSSAEETVGRPELLAAVAGREFRRRTFAGRHPVLTFVLGPIPIVLVAFLAPLIACIGCCWLIGTIRGEDMVPGRPIYGEAVLSFVLTYLLRLTPFALSTWLFVRLARRARRPAWGVIACAIVAVFASIFHVLISPATGAEPGKLMIGFDFGNQLAVWPEKGVQAAIPLAFALWMCWRMRSSMDLTAKPARA
jgi:hypothetical protein